MPIINLPQDTRWGDLGKGLGGLIGSAITAYQDKQLQTGIAALQQDPNMSDAKLPSEVFKRFGNKGIEALAKMNALKEQSDAHLHSLAQTGLLTAQKAIEEAKLPTAARVERAKAQLNEAEAAQATENAAKTKALTPGAPAAQAAATDESKANAANIRVLMGPKVEETRARAGHEQTESQKTRAETTSIEQGNAIAQALTGAGDSTTLYPSGPAAAAAAMGGGAAPTAPTPGQAAQAALGATPAEATPTAPAAQGALHGTETLSTETIEKPPSPTTVQTTTPSPLKGVPAYDKAANDYLAPYNLQPAEVTAAKERFRQALLDKRKPDPYAAMDSYIRTLRSGQKAENKDLEHGYVKELEGLEAQQDSMHGVLNSLETGGTTGGPSAAFAGIMAQHGMGYQDPDTVRQLTEGERALADFVQSGGGFGGHYRVQLGREVLPSILKGKLFNLMQVDQLSAQTLAHVNQIDDGTQSVAESRKKGLRRVQAKAQADFAKTETLWWTKGGDKVFFKGREVDPETLEPVRGGATELPSDASYKMGSHTFTGDVINKTARQQGVTPQQALAMLKAASAKSGGAQ